MTTGAKIKRSDAKAAHQASDRDPEQRYEKNGFHSEAPRQRRRCRRKQAEANHRQHGQHADAENGNAEVALDVAEKQRHRRDGRTQIETDQQDGRDRPGGMAQHRRPRPSIGSAAAFRTATPRLGLIGKDVHARLVWTRAPAAAINFFEWHICPIAMCRWGSRIVTRKNRHARICAASAPDGSLEREWWFDRRPALAFLFDPSSTVRGWVRDVSH